MKRGIFISYRREDSAGTTGRLYDRLSEEFGTDRIFMDVDAIDPGVDFLDAIEQAVEDCEALVVVIGERWLDSDNRRRLNDPDDYVRLEIRTALKRNILVIPVLVDGATMPSTDELPPELQALSFRNALEIRYTRFQTDTDQLVTALKKRLGLETEPKKTRSTPTLSRRTAWIVGVGVLAVAIVVGKTSLVSTRDEPRDSRPGESETALAPAPGERVLAPRNGDDCLYPGTVLERQGDSLAVRFEFGEERWVPGDEVYDPAQTPSPSTLTISSDVYVELERVRVWAPGKVKEIRDENYLVSFTSNPGCVRDRSHVWVPGTNYSRMVIRRLNKGE